jgi:hypothetical protein
MPARLQHRNSELGGDLAQVHRAQMVGAAMAGGGSGHIRQHDVGLAAKRLGQLSRRIIVEKVLLAG